MALYEIRKFQKFQICCDNWNSVWKDRQEKKMIDNSWSLMSQHEGMSAHRLINALEYMEIARHGELWSHRPVNKALDVDSDFDDNKVMLPSYIT